MDIAKHFTGPKVVSLLDAPAIISYLIGGSVQIEKAGVTAAGPTQKEAALEWVRKFSEIIARPKSLVVANAGEDG
jgi:hypothetical protein